MVLILIEVMFETNMMKRDMDDERGDVKDMFLDVVLLMEVFKNGRSRRHTRRSEAA